MADQVVVKNTTLNQNLDSSETIKSKMRPTQTKNSKIIW